MTLSEIRNILNDEDIMLTKSLGQTFMHDQNQLRKIVALAKLAQDDSLIEIGPGLGPLTGLLLEAVSRVTAIETDRRLIKLLEERLGQREQARRADHLLAGLEPALQLEADHPAERAHLLRRDGGCFALELSTEEAAKALPAELNLFRDATSLGGVESLIEW